MHPKVAQDLMRHSDITTTMGYYTHTILEQRRDAVAKLPALDRVNACAVKTGTDATLVSYRSAYRNDADLTSGSADCDGRSSNETATRHLSSAVEQCFRKA